MSAAKSLGHTVMGVVVRQRESLEFLLLRRVEALGGFWQPVTGAIDGQESPRQAVLREIHEETGLHETPQVHDLRLAYEFVAREGDRFHVQGFAIEVPSSADVVLSEEHDSYRWVSYDEALSLVSYDEDRWALARALCSTPGPPASV